MPQTTDQLTETVRKALHRAYNLGQTYWQQADSESYAANKRSEETAAKFDQLSAETLAALSAVPLVAEAPREPPLPEGWATEALEAIWNAPIGTTITADMKRAASLALRVARGERWDDASQEWGAPPASLAQAPKKLWLWKNFVDGRPEYWAFDNPYPIHLTDGDPQTLGQPCGYALFKPSRDGSCGRTEEQVLREMASVSRVAPPVLLAPMPEELPEPALLKTPEGDDYTDDTAAKWAWFAHGYDTGMEPFFSADQMRELAHSVRAAVLASVAPQPEQPNTEQPHLAASGNEAVEGGDADVRDAARYRQLRSVYGTGPAVFELTAHGDPIPGAALLGIHLDRAVDADMNHSTTAAKEPK